MLFSDIEDEHTKCLRNVGEGSPATALHVPEHQNAQQDSCANLKLQVVQSVTQYALFKCHAISRYTPKCNCISAHFKRAIFSAPLFAKSRTAQHCNAYISCTNFHPNPIISVESRDRNSLGAVREVSFCPCRSSGHSRSLSLFCDLLLIDV